MIRRTSIDTYNEIQDSGFLGNMQKAVYDAIYRFGPLTQNELHKNHFPERQPRDVQPRVSELVKLGVVECVGKRECGITGRLCMIWDVTGDSPMKAPRNEGPRPEIICANEHASAPRLLAWIKDDTRRPANTAFTEGPDRQVAYAVEWLFTQLRDARDEIRRLKNGELF